MAQKLTEQVIKDAIVSAMKNGYTITANADGWGVDLKQDIISARVNALCPVDMLVLGKPNIERSVVGVMTEQYGVSSDWVHSFVLGFDGYTDTGENKNAHAMGRKIREWANDEYGVREVRPFTKTHHE